MKSEHKQAKAWREQMGLTTRQLADMTGYSEKTLYWHERGLTPPRTWRQPATRAKNKKQDPDRNIDPQVWKRYKNACAGVAAQLFHKREFNWGSK